MPKDEKKKKNGGSNRSAGGSRSRSSEEYLFLDALSDLALRDIEEGDVNYEPTDVPTKSIDEYNEWAKGKDKLYSPLERWAERKKPEGYDQQMGRRQRAADINSLSNMLNALTDIAGAGMGAKIGRRKDNTTRNLLGQKESLRQERNQQQEKYGDAKLRAKLSKIKDYKKYQDAIEAYNRDAELSNIQSENQADQFNTSYQRQKYQNEKNRQFQALMAKERQRQSMYDWLKKQKYLQRQGGGGYEKGDDFKFRLVKGEDDYTGFHDLSVPGKAGHYIDGNTAFDIIAEIEKLAPHDEQIANDVSQMRKRLGDTKYSNKEAIQQTLMKYWDRTPTGKAVISKASSGNTGGGSMRSGEPLNFVERSSANNRVPEYNSQPTKQQPRKKTEEEQQAKPLRQEYNDETLNSLDSLDIILNE